MKYNLAVVGKSIAYSQSPWIHSEFAKAAGIDLQYSIEEVGPDSTFAEKIGLLQEAGFQGCNITVPYKEAAFSLADICSPAAEDAEAANTFHFSVDGIFADNTDGLGFMQDLTHNIGFSPRGKRVLICGAGGAVRGILGPLLKAQPAEIILANRTLEKARTVVARFQASSHSLVTACTYADLAQRTVDLLIDGTSLKTEPLPLPADFHLAKSAVIYDLKYNLQTGTAMMHWAKANQVNFYDGIGMLVEQAAAAFKLWTGIFPSTLPVISALKARHSI